jgi:hypothetical protein
LLAGCASVGAEDQAVTSELDNGAIAFDRGGVWFRNVGCPSADPATCLREANFWIDLRVRNDAYDKTVGVVWIDRVREAETGQWHLSPARYEGTTADGYETWGVDVAVRVINGIEPNPQIRFAAFVEMAGDTAWDNNGGADHVIQ